MTRFFIRVVLGIAAMVASVFAYGYNDAAKAVSVSIANPDARSAFAEMAGMSAAEVILKYGDAGLSYIQARTDFDNAVQVAKNEVQKITRQRDFSIGATAIFMFLLATTFLPWIRWSTNWKRNFAHDTATIQNLGKSATSLIAQKSAGAATAALNIRKNVVRHGNLSIADELTKWKSLLENGTISKEEYENARKELLRIR